MNAAELGLLAFAIVVALFVILWPADWLLNCLKSKINKEGKKNLQDDQTLEQDKPAVIGPEYIGRTERLFFTATVALHLPSYLTAMMLWIGAKMAANWRRQEDDSRLVRGRSIRALILGVTSMGIALAVGLTLRWSVIHLYAVFMV